MYWYSGIVLEQGKIDTVLHKHLSPYTEALLKCFEIGQGDRMSFIPGTAPDLKVLEQGCPFAPRCEYVMDICKVEVPELQSIEPEYLVACHKH